jgi:hypothetical protein
VHESDSGIWCTGVLKCFPQYGFPEIFALDDEGRCTILVGYSGVYSTNLALQDREWLGALEPVELDPRVPGPELYTGGKRGILYQVVPHPDASFDSRVIGRTPAEEIHMFASGDLDPARPGNELLVFTHTGHVYALEPLPEPGGAFELRRIAILPGRVRQTLLLPAEPGAAPRIAAACRSGQVLSLGLADGVLAAQTLVDEPAGFGRLALRPGSQPGSTVLYATRDDGVILRLAQRAGEWERELVYAGPAGPRGIAAGRFDADPGVETIAIFGYSSRVELLSRSGPGAWRAETIFTDRDRGHWLCAAELDGRNATDELLGSGYGGRVFLLAREPGHGLAGYPCAPRP